MLSKPQNVDPNNSAVDATIYNTFSFVFNGDELAAYQVVVKNSSDLRIIYTGNKINHVAFNNETVTVQIPENVFYNGNDLLWSIKLWQPIANIGVVSGVLQAGSTNTIIKIRQHPQVKADMFLKIGNQQKKIISYNYETGTAVTEAFSTSLVANTPYQVFSDFICSNDFFFKARKNPTVRIAPVVPLPLNKRYYNFLGKYSQEQNTPIKYHIWNIYDSDNLIFTTDKVFSSNLQYKFDGFLSQQYYYIELIIVNQDDIQVLNKIKVDVLYNAPNINIPPVVTVLDEKGAVQLDWVADKQSSGIATKGRPSYSFVDNFPFNGTNSVFIESGEIYYSSISEKPINLDNTYTVYISTNLTDNFQGKILQIDDHFVELKNYDFIDNIGYTRTKIASVFKKITAILPYVPVAQPNTGYIWWDDNYWNDANYWVESVTPISSKFWKIVLLPYTAICEEMIV